MEESPHGARQAAAVAHVRAVGVALLVRERVVLAVVGDPLDHRALDGRRAEDGPHRAQRPAGLEAPVGEEAVVADRHAEADRHVHDREDDQVLPVERPAPGLVDGEGQEKEGDDRDGDVRDPVAHAPHLGEGATGGHRRARVRCLRGGTRGRVDQV